MPDIRGRSFEYVRKHYSVPAEYGRRVIVDGEPGIIIKDCGAQLGVNFDARKPNDVAYCHPTWRVEYGDMGTPRKITRSQQRYMDYLDVADFYGSFKGYLMALSHARLDRLKMDGAGFLDRLSAEDF